MPTRATFAAIPVTVPGRAKKRPGGESGAIAGKVKATATSRFVRIVKNAK
jgi:hypothetical protein